MTAFICMNELQQFVNGKSFDEIKTLVGEHSLYVREKKLEGEYDLKNVYMVCVDKKYDNDTATEKMTPLQRQANGIVLEKGTNMIVTANNNKLYNLNSVEELVGVLGPRGITTDGKLTSDNQKVRIEYCEDGTVIRLYNYKNNWYTATPRCLDATKSYWSSDRTFDEMFWQIFDVNDLQALDKDYTYMFVLLHQDNRIVVRHSENELIYISRIRNSTLEEDFDDLVGIKYSKIKRPEQIEELNTTEKIKLNPSKRGILVKLFDNTLKTWDVYKLDFEEYMHVKDIRGNVSHIRMRFLELLKDPMSLDMLEQYYPEYSFLFSMIKNSLLNITHAIHKLYIDSHIKHTVQVTEDNMYYRTLKQLHAQYKTTQKPIRQIDVANKLYNMDKHVLKRFLGWV